jgi:hypothetical protein
VLAEYIETRCTNPMPTEIFDTLRGAHDHENSLMVLAVKTVQTRIVTCSTTHGRTSAHRILRERR